MGGKASTAKGPETTAGDGIRSLQTTGVFKAVNFELYVKPNLAIMAFGVVAILCSTGYLAYMKAQHRESKTYIAIAEDGSQHLTHKRSKWD
ncbi:protein of unknown function (DUF4500) [Halocaridina rubra]|uniref:Small integral membrane protein 8 n=1 Tax=Halocaridina rubra TaxID=373956 RepID=A0AAN8XUQ7_HALRR